MVVAVPSPNRRVRMIGGHLRSANVHHHSPVRCPAGAQPCDITNAHATAQPKVLLKDDEVKAFLINGWHILPGPRIGLPDALHDRIYDEGISMLAESDSGQLVAENVTSRIPAVQEICSSPVVSGAIQSLLGEGYALHPHTFLHSTFPGNDQDFHKDGILPWNGHAMRTHQPEYMLMLYYPQDTPEDLGPTEILPCTQYFHNDSSPEHGYPLAGRTIGGGVSREPDFAQRDANRAAVLKQVGWPVETTPKKVIVPKGSVAFTHFDVYHRGTRRNPQLPDDAQTRLMVKLWFVRTQDNACPTWDHQPADDDDAPQAFRDGWGGLGPCWTRMWHWMLGNGVTGGCGPVVPLSAVALQEQTARLNDAASDLRAAAIEPFRVGAAYALAAAGAAQGLAPLSAAFVKGTPNNVEVDGVMRSAMYGLAALPNSAGVPALLSAAMFANNSMELRVAGVFGLGQCAEPTKDVLECLRGSVLTDHSAFVRSTAAHMLGFVGRRAAALGDSGALTHILESLRACLNPALMDSFSPWQISPLLPSKVEELEAAGAVPPDSIAYNLRGEADFFEGNRGGGPIYPRSGMREHATQSLCYIATVVARTSNLTVQNEAQIVAPLVADLSALVAADRNRFSHGWAAEALRRLSVCSPSAARAFDQFLKSARWKPAQMQMELAIEQRKYGGDPLMPTLLAT